MGARRAGTLAATLALALTGASLGTAPGAGPGAGGGATPEAHPGARMYRSGLLPSGKPIRAYVQTDVALEATQAACANCHARSGLGYAEGKTVPPAVTGPLLYAPRVKQRRELYASRTTGPGTRPAYSDATLARAIREGLDPAGRVLDPLMPRYALDDASLALLVDYLKALGAARPPGLTDSTIHFATVVDPAVDATKRQAMLDVLETFFRDKNAGTRHERRRAQHAPFHRAWDYEAYREWVLHVWELEGPRDRWRAQLEDHYREHPVFALVSGIAEGPWDPIHAFCEEIGVPCVLPNTDLPVVAEGDFYSIYLSEGLVLEAKVLARHLAETHDGARSGPIVQVYRDDESGAAVAEALREALAAQGIDGLRDRPIAGSRPPDSDFWTGLRGEEAPAALVLWLPAGDLDVLEAAPPGSLDLPEVYLSSTLVGEQRLALPGGLAGEAYLVHPFALPEVVSRRLGPERAWLRARQIESSEQRVQANTYFAVRTLGDALMHVVGNFSREYLVEKIEHRLSDATWVSVYPSGSLGAGQRFVSKGAYIVRASPEPNGALTAVTGWIVP
jgi:hypothetical protein